MGEVPGEAYSPPQIITVGSVRDLTLGGNGLGPGSNNAGGVGRGRNPGKGGGRPGIPGIS